MTFDEIKNPARAYSKVVLGRKKLVDKIATNDEENKKPRQHEFHKKHSSLFVAAGV